MSDRTTKVSLIQMSCGSNPDENMSKAVGFIESAAAEGGEIICLPELFKNRYFCQHADDTNFDLAEPMNGPTCTSVSELAKRLGVIIVTPIFELRAPGVYHNTVAIFDETGQQIGFYRKMHIPDDPQFEEKYYFTPGDTGFISVKSRSGSIGPLICWDQWYPEAARITALKGAEMLVYPTAIGWLPGEKEEGGERYRRAWQLMQQSHAIANGVYVISINRTGFEPGPSESGIDFWGTSFVADPLGTIVAEASVDREEVITVELDLSAIEKTRRIWPFLRDRRIDAYQDVTQRMLDSL